MPNTLPLDEPARQPQTLAGSLADDMFTTPHTGFDFRYLLAAIRRNLLLIGAIVGVTLAGAVAVTLLQTPRYTASSTVQINDSSTRVLDDKSAEQGDESGSGYDTDRFLQTQVDVLQSRGLAVRVAQKLKLDSSARFFSSQEADLPPASAPSLAVRNQVVGMLLTHLHVNLPRDSRIVTIQYDSTDPAMSADIANAYASEFIQANLQRRYDSSSYARDFVSNQLAETKQKLEDSERALNDYARKSGLIRTGDAASLGAKASSQGGGSVTTDSLVELNQAANEATAKRIAAQGRWEAINKGSLYSSTEVVGNPTMSTLLAQRATIETQLAEEQARHLDAYPAVKAKQDELAGINRQLQQVATNIRASIRADFDAARNSEQQLTGEVNRLKGATLSEQDSNVQYGLLAREVDTNRQVYDGLLQRYKDLNASSGISLSNISIIDTADPPGFPSSPNLMKNLAIALLIGVGLAAATLFLKDQFDDSIRVPEDIESKLGLPLLGIIPRTMPGVEPEEAMMDPKSPIAEAYNSLRGSLLYATTEGLPQVMLVTSAQPAEGKSTISYAMALSFARMGKTVVLFDADLRRPSLHRLFGYSNQRGLSSLLTSQDSLASAAQSSDHANLTLVPSGPVPISPTELLSSLRLEQILQEAARHFDVVLIDSPPILGLADAPTMGALVDGVIFVVEADRSRRGALKMALRRLRAMRPVLLGAVLTKFDPLKAGNRYSEYYGNRYYQYDAATNT